MHHLPGAPERQQERSKEGKGSKRKNSLFMQVGRLKKSNSNIQKERMRIRREADRGTDTRRQACAAEAVWEKVRIGWRGPGGPFY